MEANPKTVDETQESAGPFDATGKLSGFEHVKNRIADKLHHMAQTISVKAADPSVQPDVAAYEKQASEWLDHSSRYVRQFDYKQTDAKARQYIRQNPGRSILIAGAAGLIIGAVLRRRQG
jgi:ElaB/YqjD/DUF883 family membrane-anchored ribosome-binding protein